MQTDFKLYKVDMKYIQNLNNVDDKVLCVLPQARKDYPLKKNNYSIFIQLYSREKGKTSDITRNYVLKSWNGVRQIMNHLQAETVVWIYLN